MLYKDTPVDFNFPFVILNAAKGRTKLRFVACITSCSIISYRCSILVSDHRGNTSVVWLTSIYDHKTELRSPIHVLVHSTWWDEQDDKVQHFYQHFRNSCTFELTFSQEFTCSFGDDQ